MCYRSDVLADRLLQGANGLAELVATLTTEEWRTPIEGDGPTVGMVVQYAAHAYPIEVELARVLAKGEPVEDVTMADLEAPRSGAHDRVGRDEAISLLRENSAAAALAIRGLRTSALDSVAPASLYDDAPVSCQFLLEDRAVRHGYRHAAEIRAALGRRGQPNQPLQRAQAKSIAAA